jgi:hypothetical protein
LLLDRPVCGIARYSDITIDARLDMAVTEHSLSRNDSGNAQCRPYLGVAVVAVVEHKQYRMHGRPGPIRESVRLMNCSSVALFAVLLVILMLLSMRV